jgi:ferritin-like protein
MEIKVKTNSNIGVEYLK